MQKLFNKILVPIDFSSRSKKAIEKACDIARHYNCSIHLLYVHSFTPSTAIAMAEGHMGIPYNLVDDEQEMEERLKNMCRVARILNDDSLTISYSTRRGSWDEAIIEMVNDLHFDLVLVGQKGRVINKRKMLINPDRIAAKTNIPVVTIPSNKRLTRLMSIVVPITDFLPIRKLMYAVYMASNYQSVIRLLGIENEHTKDKVAYYIKKATDLVKENCEITVNSEITSGQNVADVVNQYARQEGIDLVILNPGTQTKMPGFLSNLFGNIIQKHTPLPVLTVNPV